MRVYLVRHAEAIPRAAGVDDALRHLTAAGRKQARRLGKRLRASDVEWDLALVSPAMRAVQTAEILAARTKFRGEILAEPLLLSGDGTWKALLAGARAHRPDAASVAFVGHEPFLGVATGEALGGGAVELPKGAVAALDVDELGQVSAVGLHRPDGNGWEPLQAPPLPDGTGSRKVASRAGGRGKRNGR